MIHKYSIDTEEHESFGFRLALVSIVSTFLISPLISDFPVFSIYIGAPSCMIIYRILSGFFDRSLWKSKIIRAIGVSTPDLNGRWKGTSVSSDQTGHTTDVVVDIRQTWTRIGVYLESSNTTSHSLWGTISIEEAGGPELIYEYLAGPKGAPEPLLHNGIQRLKLKVDDNGESLEGDYYNYSHHRGTLIVRKERRDVQTNLPTSLGNQI